jgi:preprotein translocase subunit SecF
MTQQKEKTKFKTKLAKFHDRYYKHLLLIPILIFLFFFVYMGIFYSHTGDFIHRDISLTGGTTITVNEKIDLNDLKGYLTGKLDSFSVRGISSLGTGEQIAVVIETTTGPEQSKQILEEYLNFELTDKNSSTEFTGAALSQGFFKQLLLAVLLAFVFMAIVVFIIFRTFVPSAAIIISAFADIFMTLSLLNILGIQMSTAGIIALLMLIGYSVDTDILLTNRVLKQKQGSVNSRIYSAFNTGIMMTLTSLVAVTAALLVVRSFSATLTKIFTVLVIGLGFDLLNTWVTNVSILKWYAIKKQKLK